MDESGKRHTQNPSVLKMYGIYTVGNSINYKIYCLIKYFSKIVFVIFDKNNNVG